MRLDLVIRTTAELGEAANAELSGLFQAALVNSGLQGSDAVPAGGMSISCRRPADRCIRLIGGLNLNSN